MLFLEAQFGADNVSPIAEPKLSPVPPPKPKIKSSEGDDEEADASMDVSEDEEHGATQLAQRREAELARLHKLGIPVPGINIRVDKMEAKVWLEGLEIECGNKVFGDRVRAVVERAVEVTAPLWG